MVYEFFFAFSRMELALKERRLLEHEKEDAKAKPGWSAFVEMFEADYVQSAEGMALIEARPKCQFVGPDQSLVWRELRADPNRSELANTVDALQVVRNNLFHGGKHGEKSWDDPERIDRLLTLGKVVLQQLANLHDDIRAEFLDEV
ncbi:conserved hypothetical protein [Cupriavidus taiwanensis LMG 19424]|uniref:RiboL-PSP-HEPN domain-containing protein n=1 Tax=Cupriavidus taiwanensis (strain DSM 17343 / BCRC 17206 / CCUG 44338 / CIP 107171 / LMG 19424 / R1) TaxID=977880 RepID=B3R9L9_CUPTR|nr:conserved hypothetical protein [Cupriavidus taiwanensis LMG 19424]